MQAETHENTGGVNDDIKEAIDLAVRECIGENILRDFLEQHRREVCRESLQYQQIAVIIR